jgi:hypothetical protein
MYGLMFDCLEKFVVFKYKKEIWDLLLKKANVGIGRSEWVINENYSDDFFMKLVTLLAFEVDQFSLDTLIEEIGYYFIEYAWYVSNKVIRL